jgi:hypothetical protein
MVSVNQTQLKWYRYIHLCAPALGCAVSLSSSDNTYVKMEGSEGMQFQGTR